MDGALAAIEAGGPAALSLRDVARRAGVSHAAPAHHFGDKAGLLTAIAAEGYALLAEATRTALEDGDEFLEAGVAYIRFALSHRAHYAVMFRPDLYRADDAAVVAAREAAGAVLLEGVRDALGSPREQDVVGGAVAIWSFTHGFATLALNGNFDAGEGDDPDAAVRQVAGGIVRLVQAGAFGPTPPARGRRRSPRRSPRR
jgi:AcrR family transcriptional regulator